MKTTLARLLSQAGATMSMGEGRRMVGMGAVRVNGEVQKNLEEVEVQVGDKVQVGKRKEFVVTEEML
jgi:tyrosyl-tRNA synthetase